MVFKVIAARTDRPDQWVFVVLTVCQDKQDPRVMSETWDPPDILAFQE